MAELLELIEIHSYYGGAHILLGTSLIVNHGETVALLGRNGTGKTTTLKSIMSLVTIREGKIVYDGKDIIGIPTHILARRGISIVPEGRHIFPALNVSEHLRVPISKSKMNRESLMDRVFKIFPELEERKKQNASSLSGGEQQMLAIARALMTDPKLLLLDEPMEGLSPKAVNRVIESLTDIHKSGVAMLIVSPNMKEALRVTNRAYILDKGKVVFHFTDEHLEKSPEIQAKYLGVRDSRRA